MYGGNNINKNNTHRTTDNLQYRQNIALMIYENYIRFHIKMGMFSAEKVVTSEIRTTENLTLTSGKMVCPLYTCN